ncbi:MULTISPECIES: RNA polymerase sigma factor [Alcaligenes]|jgi:RNA polymerase sigma-70 factor (ECF subfamily)|uniref:Sigma-70 family RNA polymerase sigma factor n=1 Tax=Alcaligenes aquatilis TaxID=323284 RepID=A0ABY4NL64_9BURK|nr:MULTISPECIES: sigma-70 family RNA polymerase sigma factor [Alcaligenes]MCC9163203.1 sigma-70 family RNA polymerase sigma factor [Alcaligenes sp. MMA]MCH4223981.1 sigma-70 family RNA polymerase sigma factor [Alcaligenes faecalis]UQN37219.1 sigma-70 family RNA polymerase sigma factor [Alcaligenes aquatilis]UYY88538.1 sigma-70 family RNA polymerase sigma factor [Alcaligenes sp. SMD-FA]HBQ91119.1 RNA polymerase ECF-subfamily sigma-70 factor [Alcaligenes faecalis]
MSHPSRPRKAWLASYSELFGLWRRKAESREDAEDAMHDTVVGMLENNTALIDNPRAYLARGTSNRLISRHRHQTVLTVLPLDELSDTEHPRQAGADSHAQFEQLADALVSALADLPPKCREVYIKHRLEGWTHTEIAQDMALSRSMVEKYMTRALRHIHERLHHYVPD